MYLTTSTSTAAVATSITTSITAAVATAIAAAVATAVTAAVVATVAHVPASDTSTAEISASWRFTRPAHASVVSRVAQSWAGCVWSRSSRSV